MPVLLLVAACGAPVADVQVMMSGGFTAACQAVAPDFGRRGTLDIAFQPDGEWPPVWRLQVIGPLPEQVRHCTEFADSVATVALPGDAGGYSRCLGSGGMR